MSARTTTVLSLTAAALAVAFFTAPAAPDPAGVATPTEVSPGGPAATVPADRLFSLAASTRSSDVGALRDLAARSDQARDGLSEREARDFGHHVRQRLHETVVGEEEARAYHAAHAELFGGRSFEASRQSIDRLVAIDRMLAELSEP